MKHFVALSFQAHGLHYQKVHSFKKRFDIKYFEIPELHLPLLPPFNLKNEKSFLEDMKDSIENQFFGDNKLKISFKDLKCISGKRQSIFLVPKIPEQIMYCQESFYEIINEYNGSFLRNGKKNMLFQSFLPLARFDHSEIFMDIYHLAKEEIEFPLYLFASEFKLFTKVNSKNYYTKTLFKFDKQNGFLNLMA